jgi:hypothetical protein
MKILKVITLTIGLLLGSNQNINAQTFVKKQGAATDITINPKDGSVYVVGTSKNVFKYDTRSKKFKPFGKQSKNIKSITVHSNGSLYMVSTSNEVYIDVNGRWNKIPGIKTTEVDIDKNGNVRALDLSGKLKKLFQGKWKDESLVNRNTSGFNQIIGQDSKVVYGRFKNNAFKIHKSGKWTTLNGSPLKITMDDKTGEVYAVGRNKGIYKWNSSTSKWVLLKNTRKDFKDLAVHNGKIWAVATNKAIYYYDNNKRTKDYSGKYKVTVTRVLLNAPEFKIGKNIDVYGTIGVYVESKTKSGNTKINDISNKKPRIWEVSKSKPEKPYFKFKNYIEYTYWVDGKSYANRAFGEIKINRTRSYNIQGEAANKTLTFDVQTNISQKAIPVDIEFRWERLHVNIDEVVFGREYFIRKDATVSPANNVAIGFKIEKQ